MRHNWQNYVRRLKPKQREKLLLRVLAHVIEQEDVGYRAPENPEYPDEPEVKEAIYWKSSGESIL